MPTAFCVRCSLCISCSKREAALTPEERTKNNEQKTQHTETHKEHRTQNAAGTVAGMARRAVGSAAALLQLCIRRRDGRLLFYIHLQILFQSFLQIILQSYFTCYFTCKVTLLVNVLVNLLRKFTYLEPPPRAIGTKIKKNIEKTMFLFMVLGSE